MKPTTYNNKNALICEILNQMAEVMVFIGGIHGAGKGTISEAIAASMNLIHLSASELIKWKDVSPDEKNKKVQDITDTQQRLISGLKATTVAGKKYILDGHFCLLNKFGKPEKVPINTFKKISPFIIAVVIENVEKISERLEKRDEKKYDLDLLMEMQNLEVSYAAEVAQALSIPLAKIENGNIQVLINTLKQSF